MVNQYTKNKIRLLSMLHDQYSGQNGLVPDVLPFTAGDDGLVILSPQLEDRLKQEGDSEFEFWVRNNISNLSE